MVNRPISPHRLRKFSHRLAVERDLFVNGQTEGSAVVDGLDSVPCSAPQPADATKYRELDIETFQNKYTVFALVMAAQFRKGDSVTVDGRTYALDFVRRWPEIDGVAAELLLEAR